MLDLLIENATVYDGLGGPPREEAVGVRDGRIALVGEPPADVQAKERLDARGLALCPGFIDTHASTGLGYLVPDASDNKLFQGVTTEVIGNCGTSDAPVGPHHRDTVTATCDAMGVPHGWETLAQWKERLADYGLPINVASYVGHGTLRAGYSADPSSVTSDELSAMKEALATALQQGATGLATGLVYAPGSFADTDEIVELAKIAAAHGRTYASHMRNEREGLEAAVEETIEIGRRAELPVLISHLKAAERPNWGKIPPTIERVEQARREGVDVAFEVYPYTAVSTRLRTFLPKDILEEGIDGLRQRLEEETWQQRSMAWLDGRETAYETMTLVTESLPGTQGKSVATVAENRGTSGAQTVVDVLRADPEAWIVYDCLSPDDLDAAVLSPLANIISDSWSYPWNAPVQIGDPHPRTFGAFARFLERYAVSGRLPFEEAVRKITSLPAQRMGFNDRGRIATGHAADLVLLDPAGVAEMSTFAKPRQFAKGVEKVWVNGELVVADGAVGDARPGHFLSGQRSEGQRSGAGA